MLSWSFHTAQAFIGWFIFQRYIIFQVQKIQRTKILFLIQLPPPVHGASVMNQYVKNSLSINGEVDGTFVNISLGEKSTELGRFTFRKIGSFTQKVFLVAFRLLFARPDLAYITPATYGYPFLKDSFFLILLRVFRIERIIHLHGKGIKEEMKRNSIKNFYYNLVFKNAHIIHLAECLLSDIEYIRGIKSIHILPNGIPFSEIEKKPEPGTAHILFLSNFLEEKGAMQVLNAAKILLEKTGEFELYMVGDWLDSRFKIRLISYFDSLDWKNKVHITGPLYGEEKARIFQNSDILVFPSYNECFPLTILEAMSFGLAIIASKEGAIPEMLTDGETGILVEARDPEMIAEKLLMLIQNINFREKLGAAAREEFLKKFTLGKFENNFLQIIRDVNKLNSL